MTPALRRWVAAKRVWYAEGIAPAVRRFEHALGQGMPRFLEPIAIESVTIDTEYIARRVREGDYLYCELWLARLDLCVRHARRVGHDATHLVQCASHVMAAREAALEIFLDLGGSRVLSEDERAPLATEARAARRGR